ncbi:MAG: hypothetical protein A2319_01975 [Candidatus Kerfeldbacteria bacterium RIFOXYB2_FULL_38_14]|uniref:Uncharacterized protein n=1 Tax=Candidatus Kerfeldbacteria bacterium RIFOXYB2_FULL_38_14 TaxID=1798547 RepID=A0A1G2BBH8_9BACT|nr:MAG: hypothetical protein A2319_01975 [Candidatus Kerfeldbacteria bacterium RIFOXYB2_FULL_38_14]
MKTKNNHQGNKGKAKSAKAANNHKETKNKPKFRAERVLRMGAKMDVVIFLKKIICQNYTIF